MGICDRPHARQGGVCEMPAGLNLHSADGTQVRLRLPKYLIAVRV
ncbi:hypothetical protein [Kineosporia mesophila]|nr:hypothetical protein [Kineosporia mesophila]